MEKLDTVKLNELLNYTGSQFIQDFSPMLRDEIKKVLSNIAITTLSVEELQRRGLVKDTRQIEYLAEVYRRWLSRKNIGDYYIVANIDASRKWTSENIFGILDFLGVTPSPSLSKEEVEPLKEEDLSDLESPGILGPEILEEDDLFDLEKDLIL